MARMSVSSYPNRRFPVSLDKGLLFTTITIVLIGLLMVSSASIDVSRHLHHTAFYFLSRQLLYLLLGIFLGFIVFKIPITFFARYSPILLLFSGVLLILVLIPAFGRSMNGSSRWLSLGPIGFQASEFTKLCFLLYLAGYIDRQQESIKTSIMGSLKPLMVLSLFAFLFLLEPDFGATVVLSAVTCCLLFMAGMRIRLFMAMIVIIGTSLGLLAFLSPYRLKRLSTFLDPWHHQYDSGYQLTQSLIAFGRGGLHGVGLGNSIQKLFYLPEAHTDFLFAVLAEEFGLIGILIIMCLFAFLVSRVLAIAKQAIQQHEIYHAYLAAGLGFWIAIQASINMGVNAGLLPTKGLTLPFMSYGGSSLLIMCCVIGLLCRIDFELKIMRG
jgi:cell division protein FtsW